MLTAEQKAARIGHVTSSVVAACLGVDEHMSQIDAMLEIKGLGPDVENKACDRGNLLEELILDYPTTVHEWDRRPAPFIRHPTIPWAADSCDAIYVHRGTEDPAALGEGKSASLGMARHYGDEGTEDIPQHALMQSHWHLIHRPQFDVCSVPVLVGGFAFEFREYMVERDEQLHALMIEELTEWHARYIIGDEIPPASSFDSDTKWLTKTHPGSKTFGFMPSTEEIRQLALSKHRASEAIKAEKIDEGQAKNSLRQILGDHEGVKAEWGSVTWKKNMSTLATDWERAFHDLGMKLNAPDEIRQDLIEEHTSDKPGPRVLRVNIKKGFTS